MKIYNWIKKKLYGGNSDYFMGTSITMNPAWDQVLELLKNAGTIIDLGCGSNPHPLATAAVDAFVEPLHRDLGAGNRIDQDDLLKRGVTFYNADIAKLPSIKDKSFDFAYSHHVFEHHPDPLNACKEIQRIAKAGAIITPSAFTEIAFGRPYHIWFVLARGNTLIFVKKRKVEDCPFGDHPVKSDDSYIATSATNPFDILLNDDNWYRGTESFPRLGNLLKKYWYSHSPVIETVFIWENSFECVVIDEDGAVMMS